MSAYPSIIKGSTYNGAELGRTCMRDGAYDAFDLPSLRNGVRHPHRGPAPMQSARRVPDSRMLSTAPKRR